MTQVACPTVALCQKSEAENFGCGGRITLPPVAKVDSNADMSPCTWNNGMIKRTVSFGVNEYVRDMLSILVNKFVCVNGTPYTK